MYMLINWKLSVDFDDNFLFRLLKAMIKILSKTLTGNFLFSF